MAIRISIGDVQAECDNPEEAATFIMALKSMKPAKKSSESSSSRKNPDFAEEKLDLQHIPGERRR